MEGVWPNTSSDKCNPNGERKRQALVRTVSRDSKKQKKPACLPSLRQVANVCPLRITYLSAYSLHSYFSRVSNKIKNISTFQDEAESAYFLTSTLTSQQQKQKILEYMTIWSSCSWNSHLMATLALKESIHNSTARKEWWQVKQVTRNSLPHWWQSYCYGEGNVTPNSPKVVLCAICVPFVSVEGREREK
jgi:hypothetical protein